MTDARLNQDSFDLTSFNRLTDVSSSHPVEDGGVQNYIKMFWGHRVALSYTLALLERAFGVPAGPGLHGEAVPVRMNKSNHPETDPVCREKFQGPFPV